jgi:LPS export ABC transporter permease LptG
MLIFFYIFKQFMKFTSGIVVLSMFMFVLSDLVDKYGRLFERYNASISDVVEYYLYETPFQMIQIIPFAALIGAIATMVMLNRSGEIIAIRASGVGPFRLAKGIVLGGLICAVFTIICSEYIVPKAVVMRNQLVDSLKGEKSIGAFDVSWMKSGRWIYTFQEYDLASKTLVGLKAFRRTNSNDSISQIWIADRAVYVTDTKRWMVVNRKKVKLAGGKVESVAKLPDRLFDLPYKPERLFKDERSPIELSFSELYMKVSEMKSASSQYRRYEVSLHVKIGYSLAALLLSLLGLKFGFTFERSSQIMKSLLLTIVIGIGYWFVLSSARALVLSSTLPAWIAGWSANIFLLFFVFLDVRKLSRF